ncbi:hypothetical protein BVY01_01335, partial [bacterium I07]
EGPRLKRGKAGRLVLRGADTPGFRAGNPFFFIHRLERLWLFYVPVLANRWERALLKYRRSDNYQKKIEPVWTWQDVITLAPGDRFADDVKKGLDELVPEEPMWAEYALPYTRLLKKAAEDPVKRQIGWMTRTHPLTLPSGRILLPLYSDGFNTCLIAISDDDGSTWRPSRPIVGLAPEQPSLVRKKEGTLIAYLRDAGDAPYRVLISSSTDEGQSWTLARDTELPNPGSSVEAVVLEDGRWIMALNDTEDGRHQMAVIMSDDEGRTWPWKRYVGKSPQRDRSYSYPSIIQSKDGTIHLTYSYKENRKASIKHARFDPDWIKEK